MALAKLPLLALVLARYPKLQAKHHSWVKLLTVYVGHFYKATCVTHYILEVGVRASSQHSQSHRVLVFSIIHPTHYANVQLPIISQSAQSA